MVSEPCVNGGKCGNGEIGPVRHSTALEGFLPLQCPESGLVEHAQPEVPRDTFV